MRIPVFLCLCLMSAPVLAEPAKTAVFDIEPINTSEEATRPDEVQRVALVSKELRTLLEASDQLQLVDLGPQADVIRKQVPLHKCNGCEQDIAKALGADVSVSGVVQKTSNLILSFAITITDVASGKAIRGGQVDIRGNTDSDWLRGVRWVVKNRLLAEPLPIRS